MRLTKKTMQIQVKHRLNSRIESIVFVVYVSKVGGAIRPSIVTMMGEFVYFIT